MPTVMKKVQFKMHCSFLPFDPMLHGEHKDEGLPGPNVERDDVATQVLVKRLLLVSASMWLSCTSFGGFTAGS